MAESDFSTLDPGELVYATRGAFDRVRALNIEAAEKTRIFADLARLNTLYAIARGGSGHIGSSFSSMDMVASIYLHFLQAGDVYFSSKGHDVPGLYSVMIGMGVLPFEKLHGLRQLGGLPGHPDVHVPGIPFNTGSLGMGISKSKGFVRANRLKNKTQQIYVMLGDGELQEGQIWESLGSAVTDKMWEITAIVDHNKFQSDTYVSRTGDLGDLQAKFASFGWRVERCDGNDASALMKVFTSLRADRERPKILIADTVKGSGVSFMQHTSMTPDQEFYKYHSGAPSQDDYLKAVGELLDRVRGKWSQHVSDPLPLERVAPGAPAKPSGDKRMIPAYSEALIGLAGENKNIVAFDADLILDTGLIPYRDKFPDRFFECGIAEMDMVSQAGAMALNGFVPVVHSFACFLTTRPNEQIFNCATEMSKVIYVGSLAGLVPSGPGHSHQSVRDIALLSSVPGMTVVEPSCPEEIAPLLRWAVAEAPGPVYMRLVSIPVATPYAPPAGYKPQPGKGWTIKPGRDVAIIAYGPIMLPQALIAAAAIERQAGVSVGVVNLPWLCAVDEAWLAAETANARLIVTIDNHMLAGGLGERVRAALVNTAGKAGRRVISLGIEGIPACGRNDDVMKHHRLDADSIAETVAAALKS